MKDLTKIYINLSKCSEEERKSLPQILEKAGQDIFSITDSELKKGKYRGGTCLLFYRREWVNTNHKYLFENKQELTYPEFIKLFEEGETIKSDNTQTLQNALQQIEKLEADKKELVEALQYVYGKYKIDGHLLNVSPSKIESLIQKHKQ